jgi:hypothetical protein
VSEGSIASSVASCDTPCRMSEDGGASCCSSLMGSWRSSLANSISCRAEQVSHVQGNGEGGAAAKEGGGATATLRLMLACLAKRSQGC